MRYIISILLVMFLLGGCGSNPPKQKKVPTQQNTEKQKNISCEDDSATDCQTNTVEQPSEPTTSTEVSKWKTWIGAKCQKAKCKLFDEPKESNGKSTKIQEYLLIIDKKGEFYHVLSCNNKKKTLDCSAKKYVLANKVKLYVVISKQQLKYLIKHTKTLKTAIQKKLVKGKDKLVLADVEPMVKLIQEQLFSGIEGLETPFSKPFSTQKPQQLVDEINALENKKDYKPLVGYLGESIQLMKKKQAKVDNKLLEHNELQKVKDNPYVWLPFEYLP